MDANSKPASAPPELDVPAAATRLGGVGRERELARLEALFAAGRDSGGGRVALVTGEAGIGKSRVLDELRARLELTGVPVLEGRCREAAPPYLPVIEIVEAAVRVLGGTPAASRGREVVESLRGRQSVAAAPGSQDLSAGWELKRAALFEQVSSFLVDVARPRPVCVLVHDLHLADGATRGLVAHLAQTRFGAPELDGVGSERLWGLLALTSRDLDDSWLAGAAGERVALSPLDAEGVRAFLQSPEVVAFFAEATGGRPRALEALLESRPVDADELLRARVERLSPAARGLVEALAVFGRPAGVETLRRVAGVEDGPIARAVAELNDARVAAKLVVDGELRLGFLRAGDEQAIYRRLDEKTRRRLHASAGRLQAASLSADAPSDDLVAVAEHLLRGAVGEEAVEAALIAGERLEITYGYDRAIDLYRRAHATTTRDDVRAVVEARLCELERLVGDYGAALENAERLRRRKADAAAHRRLAQLHVLRDELDLALAALAEASRLALPSGDRAELGRVQAQRAEAYFLAGRHDEAKLECAAALESSDDDDVEAQDRRLAVQNTLGKVVLSEGNYVGASDLFAANLSEARRLGRAFEECRALFNLGIAQLRLGNAVEAQARYQAALKVAEASGDLRNRAFCLQNLGVLAHWRNDYATALTYFHDAVTAFKTIGQRARLAWLALDLASVYLDLNETGRAQAMVDLADRFADRVRPAAVAIDRELLEGRIRARRGELDQAVARLESAEARARGADDHERSVEALLHLCRVELERGQLADADARLAGLDHIAAQGTRARALLVGGELEVARGEPLKARRLLLEAAELFHRLGDLEGEWRAHYQLGRAAQARGDQAEADRRYRTAQTIDSRVREQVPEEHRAAHGDDRDRRALERALGLPRVLRIDEPARDGANRERPRLLPPISEAPPPRYPRIIGKSPKLTQVFNLLDKIAPAQSLVLIRGESGTGKELIADAIHSGSSRAKAPLVKVNCGALVETLLLSELFGHERGAFTGALARKKGRFEAADGGTIFLDEIGDISPKTQVALLRVLQEREFERVGGNTPVKVNVRILCATNRNLEQMVARGEFREDLYYRLKGIQIELPPLRERAEDIPVIADTLLERVAEERGPGHRERKRLSPDAEALLMSYAWPGNVRELENVIRSVSLFADGPLIGVSDFADYTEVFRNWRGDLTVPREAPRVAAVATVASDDGAPAPSSWLRLSSEKLSLKELKTKIEVECITEALTRARGNITRAAELLGMKRPRLSQLIKEHGITVDEGNEP